MNKSRLRELDFLRGIAILLVLLRHQPLFKFTTEMGWIGVDLFFVLSGYLVSGLLFKEYLKFGDIKPGLFLIRRGYKIYPIYYISFLIYLSVFIFKKDVKILDIFSELFFIQNYTNGVGAINPVSWSLAVEEHFYIGLVFILWLSLKKKWISLKVDHDSLKFGVIEFSIFGLMVLCLLFRISFNDSYNLTNKSFTMTHLRIDSLFAGVLIAYFYFFKRSILAKLLKFKVVILTFIVIGLFWTTYTPANVSYFTVTIGFTLLFVSFGLLLIYFLMERNINEQLNRIFSKPIVNMVSKIGYSSYSIYIFHIFVIKKLMRIIYDHTPYYNHRLNFIVTSFISILIGIAITYSIEKYFLKKRDKNFPARIY